MYPLKSGVIMHLLYLVYCLCMQVCEAASFDSVDTEDPKRIAAKSVGVSLSEKRINVDEECWVKINTIRDFIEQSALSLSPVKVTREPEKIMERGNPFHGDEVFQFYIASQCDRVYELIQKIINDDKGTLLAIRGRINEINAEIDIEEKKCKLKIAKLWATIQDFSKRTHESPEEVSDRVTKEYVFIQEQQRILNLFDDITKKLIGARNDFIDMYTREVLQRLTDRIESLKICGNLQD